MSNQVIITGATKGLGRALALEFGRNNHSVIGLYHSDKTAAQGLEAEFQSSDIQGKLLQHDISSGPFEFATSPGIQKLTVIHNACAPFHPKSLHLWTEQDFAAQWQVAVQGAFHLFQSSIRQMVALKGGTFISILTEAVSETPPKGFSGYVAAKYGLLGVTRSIAAEYGQRGIRAFCCAPGFMETPLTQAWNPDLQRSIAIAQGKADSPTEIASWILELVQNATDIPASGIFSYKRD